MRNCQKKDRRTGPCRGRAFPLACVLHGALAFAAIGPAALAQQTGTQYQMREIVVSATRLHEPLPGTSTTVIDDEDLARMPLSTLPEIIGVEAGVQMRDLFGGTAGARATVDMRGFGAPGKQNMLILLDGRRLNDIDLAAIDYANIPRDSIARIEITRGNVGGVLYGDGAIGGVINIVTKPAVDLAPHYSADLSAASDVYREGNFSAAQAHGDFAVNAYGTFINGNGFRDNNNILQRSLVTEFQRRGASGDVFVRLNLDSQRIGLPGARLVTPTSSELDTNRRGATTPLDFALQNGIALTVGVTRRMSDDVEVVIDAGARRKDQDADFLTFQSYVDTDLTTWSFTPRARIDHDLAGLAVQTTAGLDFYYANYNSDRKQKPNTAPQHRYDARQFTTALYAQSRFALTDAVDAHLGVRIQRLDVTAGDLFNPDAPGAFGTGKNSLTDTEYAYAFNLGAAWRVRRDLELFGRIGRSFRLPTIDERIDTEDATSFALETQTSKDAEVGARFRIAGVEVHSSLFVMETRDEIRFNPELGGGFGTNSNFDPIRRIGWENSLETTIGDDLSLKLHFTLLKAKFTAGTFDGKDVPVVSDITAAATLGWRIGETLRLEALVNYVGERWLENDEDNTFPKTPDHLLVALKLQGEVGPLFWRATVNNLLDASYFNYGVASTTTAGRFNAYPQPGRTFRFRVGVKL